jgi:hypothetical protein
MDSSVKQVLVEFEQGLKQFEGLPDTMLTRLQILMYLDEFMSDHSEHSEMLVAYALNGFKDPYEGML